MEKEKFNSDREGIARRIKEARSLAGLSQAQAAHILGFQRPTVSEIELGNRKVSAEEIIQFAALYKVDTSWLLLGEIENTSNTFKLAARELSKLSQEDKQKLFDILKILPK